MTHWTEHNGGKCPVDPEFIVEAKLRDGFIEEPMMARDLLWHHDNDETDIIAYRVQHDVMTEENDMHPDLEWLARNVSEWNRPDCNMLAKVDGSPKFCKGESLPDTYNGKVCFSEPQWLQARQDLGLHIDMDNTMTEEEEALPAKEHRNKYMREIKPGVWVDCYDVLKAWTVTNPGLQHLIKKALAPGQRGHKTLDQDMNDIVASAERARELEK